MEALTLAKYLVLKIQSGLKYLKQNKMTKNQKMLLGVAVVGVAGYLIWSSTQKKSFANVVSRKKCDPGFKLYEIWANYPNFPKSIQNMCINERKRFSYSID